MKTFLVYTDVVRTTWESFKIQVPDEILEGAEDFYSAVMNYANDQLEEVNEPIYGGGFLPDGWELQTEDDSHPTLVRRVYDLEEEEEDLGEVEE